MSGDDRPRDAETRGHEDRRSGQLPDPGPAPDGDKAIVRGEDPPSARIPLSRERIVATAVEFIDTHGLPGLSMRRLGTVLGVEAMALYRHVPGREELLDAVVDHIVDEVAQDVEFRERPEHGWQDYLQRLAHGIRRVALAHPLVFPLVASRPTEAPWLRPPLRSLDWVEAFLAALSGEGFNDTAVVEAYRAFTSFLLGHLLLEVASLGADLGPLDVVDEDAESSLAPYPNVARLGRALREDHATTEFEDSLENLLHRLALMRAEA